MVDVFRIKPEENFIKSIADFILGQRDPENFIVVFPNTRPSIYLKKYLSSSKILFPHILSIDEFIKELFFKKKDFAEADFYDAFNVFATVLRDDLSMMCARRMEIYEIMEITSVVWPEFEELKINMIEAKKLLDYDFLLSEVFNKDIFRNGNKNLKFARYSQLYEKFYSELEKRDLVTRSVMYMHVATNDELPMSFDKIIFAGFFLATRSEKEIFKKISQKKQTYFFFQDSPLLDEVVDFVKLPPSTHKALPLRFTLKAVSSKHTEIFALKHDISQIYKNIENKDSLPHTAIILPDPQSLIPVIENVLCDISDYNITLPFSLENTPWMSVFQITGEIHQKRLDGKNEFLYPVKKIKSLLSHQWLKDIFKSSTFDRIGRFEVFITEKKIAERFFSDIEEGEKFSSIFIEPFKDIKDIRSFLTSIARIISLIKTDEKDVFRSLGRFIDAKITEICDKEISQLSFKNTIEYFSFLKKNLSLITFPFKGEPLEAFQCMGVLESRLLNFENTFIVDLNEGVIPHEERYIFFLSDIVRKNLGLPLYSQRFKLYYYHIANTIASSKNVFIYYVENKNMAKSPILEKLIWEKEKNERRLILSDNVIYPKTNFRTHKPQRVEKNQRIKRVLEGFCFSPSSVDLYIECPLKFYFAYLIGIKEDNTSDFIEKSDIGTLFHSIIEAVFKKYRGKKLSELTSKKIACEFKREIENKIKMFDVSSPQTYFIRYQTKKKAYELSHYMINLFSSYAIEEVEFSSETHIRIPQGIVKIKGRADLVLSTSSQTLIVDFKTSSHTSQYLPKLSYFEGGKASSPGSIQLPFYLLVFKEHFNLNKNSCVISLGSKECSLEYLYKDPLAQKKYQPLIENFIISVIKEIIEKPYFEPSQDPPCNDCSYREVCSI
ncbi:MAG: PD-(D/E)XK nuclease family protein [Elusimicrobiales bacterium]